MKKIFSRYLWLLLLPLSIIMGLIRQEHIQSYQRLIGKPTMSGAFAFIGYSFLGVWSGIALFLIASIHSSKALKRKEKDILILTILLISIPVLIFTSFFL